MAKNTKSYISAEKDSDHKEFFSVDSFPQIHMVIVKLEGACLTNNDICLTYIDFPNAFGSIDHANLLALMEDLGYPRDAMELITNIYTN